MKIRELFQIEKTMMDKNKELQEAKQELENLKREIEELRLTIEINRQKNSANLVDIDNLIVVNYNGKKCFALIQPIFSGKHGAIWKMVDYFSNKELFLYYTNTANCYSIDGSFGSFLINDKVSILGKAEVVCKELMCYTNQKVPELLLQKCYYQMNEIDEKVLQKALVKS